MYKCEKCLNTVNTKIFLEKRNLWCLSADGPTFTELCRVIAWSVSNFHASPNSESNCEIMLVPISSWNVGWFSQPKETLFIGTKDECIKYFAKSCNTKELYYFDKKIDISNRNLCDANGCWDKPTFEIPGDNPLILCKLHFDKETKKRQQ